MKNLSAIFYMIQLHYSERSFCFIWSFVQNNTVCLGQI